jgi:hypothetical protein
MSIQMMTEPVSAGEDDGVDTRAEDGAALVRAEAQREVEGELRV